MTEGIYGSPALPESLDAAVLLMDKPPGWSSFDMIRRLRRILQIKKIGHAGTLDPMATGLLICCVGKATKRVNEFMGMEKEYEGTLRLGQTTASYDAESEVLEEKDWGHLTDEALEAARKHFVGEITQRPPLYSAVKVGGERLYKKARRGEEVERPERAVTVYDFDLSGKRGRDLDFLVRCSKGTYIRSIAHDFGEILGCGAHLIALRRTAIGPHRVTQAWSPEALAKAVEASNEAGA